MQSRTGKPKLLFQPEEHECGEIATFNISDFRKLGVKLYE